MLIIGRPVVAHGKPEDPDLCIGRPTAFHPDITPPPPPSDRLHPGQPDSARLGIGGPIAFQSPSVQGEDTPKPLEIPIGDRRWCTAGKSEKGLQRIRDHFRDQSHIVTTWAAPDGVESYRKFWKDDQTWTRRSQSNSGWDNVNWYRTEFVLRFRMDPVEQMYHVRVRHSTDNLFT